jgi:PEP-CTERM motif
MRAAAITAFVAALGAAMGVAGTAAAGNLVQNGGFNSLTGPANNFIGYAGFPQLNDWTYNPAPNPNAAVYTFAGANSFPGAKQGPFASYPLYGPGTGFNNGFVAPPGGGNFLASDGEPSFQGPINQTISGLTPGVRYELAFFWAGNEFQDSSSIGYTGPLTVDWQVSLGGQTFTTPVATYVGHGFTGWLAQTFSYTATSTSETLSFLAQGTPNGLPPVALLDSVSLTVPEPASWSLLILGVAGLGAVIRKRRRPDTATPGTAT